MSFALTNVVSVPMTDKLCFRSIPAKPTPFMKINFGYQIMKEISTVFALSMQKRVGHKCQ